MKINLLGCLKERALIENILLVIEIILIVYFIISFMINKEPFVFAGIIALIFALIVNLSRLGGKNDN
jgi:hypothetical protein